MITEAAGVWLQKSILSFYEHRRAEQLIRSSLDETNITPSEAHAIARSETLDHFRENVLGWQEQRVTKILDSVQSPETGSGDPHSWDRVVVLEISDRGDGLFWLDGQGDWSAPGDDVFWAALDFNADPEDNIERLKEVQKHRLEPRFAAMIDEKIQEYRDMFGDDLDDDEELEDDEDSVNPDDRSLPHGLTGDDTEIDDESFLAYLQRIAEDADCETRRPASECEDQSTEV